LVLPFVVFADNLGRVTLVYSDRDCDSAAFREISRRSTSRRVAQRLRDPRSARYLDPFWFRWIEPTLLRAVSGV
jgi:hypothetical protein